MNIKDKFNKLEKLENELSNLSEVFNIENQIKILNYKIYEIKKPYHKNMYELSNLIKNDIIQRIEILRKNGLDFCILTNEDFIYYKQDDIIYFSQEQYYRGETNYYEDELPLNYFTSSEDESIGLLKETIYRVKQEKIKKEKEILLKKT